MIQQKAKAVELFAGIGGFRIAVDRLGLRTVWANDLCPNASKIYRDRFGEKGFVEGDIGELMGQIPKHDLLTGGFPCQPFSSAGYKKGIRDPRGTLFQCVVDVLMAQTPPYFILENVKRLLTMEKGSHFATIIAALAKLNYQIEWRLLNAMHFGLPQNRQRVFIVGYPMSHNTLASRLASSQDLSDLSDRELERLLNYKAWNKIEHHGNGFPNWGIAYGESFFGSNLSKFSNAITPIPFSDLLETDVQSEFDFTESTEGRIKKSERVDRFVQGVQVLFNQKGGARMGYTVFGIEGVAPTLTCTTSRHYERYKIGERFRRLTNVEYARLQGFADDHCQLASVYDQYSLFGNAVPPPMAEWAIKKTMIEPPVNIHTDLELKQCSLYSS